jgi:DNA gyrase/topoisomerase IV subunit B
MVNTTVSQGYDERHIQTLSELQHIRQNRGMYIGDTERPNHLLYEVLDNSLDEASAKHASLIGVFIDPKEHICTVSDNGRGIPFTGNVIETIATKLFSGGKFKKGEVDSAYGIAAGLHGIGLVAVTALSDWVEFIIYRDNKKAIFKFEDAKLKNKEIIDYPSDKRPFASQVSFRPSKKYFESLDFDIDPVRERLRLASVGIPHLKLVLEDGTKQEIINCDIDDYFREAILDSQSKNVTPIFCLKNKIKDEEIIIKFAWDLNSASALRHCGSINLLSVNQGTHVNRTLTLFRDQFAQYAKKEKLSFQPQDCLVGFRAITMLSLYTPEYTSQTKDKLSTSKAKLDNLYNGLETQLDSLMVQYPEVKSQLLGFFEGYRKGLSNSKNIIKGGKEITRFNQVIDSKLKDCTTHTVENSELFITEGSSAAGGLVQCRNPKFHAILGLKGKIPNMAGGKKDFLKNKEVVEIVNSLGTGIAPDFDKEHVRYGKVIFATDADADGAHITSLLMVLFLKLVPGLIQDGTKIYRAIMPLYGGVKAGKFYPFYTEEDLVKFKQENSNIKVQRYKGLGEMNPDQLKVCLLDHNTRRLELIEYPENVDEIFKIMTDAEVKRGLLGDEE